MAPRVLLVLVLACAIIAASGMELDEPSAEKGIVSESRKLLGCGHSKCKKKDGKYGYSGKKKGADRDSGKKDDGGYSSGYSGGSGDGYGGGSSGGIDSLLGGGSGGIGGLLSDVTG
ncbi:unnamed protein product [Ostreobium quekettii]|uniref:Glycine-rich protein n=1 Tax=Ostreobium quekettii TaxID=121088 RepID=A0A8S1J5Y0_9CHLO|nr:unnamed protein product [Ostreobium quekettii]|eukprot:evm.model.scf_850.2 EVM.evm.TU.scf_850.2   scf_850:37624-39010(+)